MLWPLVFDLVLEVLEVFTVRRNEAFRLLLRSAHEERPAGEPDKYNPCLSVSVFSVALSVRGKVLELYEEDESLPVRPGDESYEEDKQDAREEGYFAAFRRSCHSDLSERNGPSE